MRERIFLISVTQISQQTSNFGRKSLIDVLIKLFNAQLDRSVVDADHE